MNNEQNIASDPSTVETPRKKTMSEAALEANRRNARKSTGPHTAAGKARSASNAFQHGLYSMRNYTHLLSSPDLVATTVHNLLEEYQPVTPTEHILVQQLIHLQLRFLQMEHVFNQFLLEGKFNTPDRAYLAVLRELDRIPARMLKTIKAIKDLIRKRGTSTNIEPTHRTSAQPVHHRIHLQRILPPHGLATNRFNNRCTRTQITSNRFRPLASHAEKNEVQSQHSRRH